MEAVAYKADEMVSISTASKKLGDIVETLKAKEKAKILIVKNNNPEAVLLDIASFEEMAHIVALIEEYTDDIAALRELIDRMHDPKNRKNYKTMEQMMAEHGID